MKSAITCAAAIAALTLAAPANAQGPGLNANQIDFLAEMLAMGDVCGQVADFRVEREEMQGWLTGRLSQESESDLEHVLTMRDEKLREMESSAAEVRDMERGFARQDAVDDHYAGLVGRCQRLTDHSLAGEYFRKVIRS